MWAETGDSFHMFENVGEHGQHNRRVVCRGRLHVAVADDVADVEAVRQSTNGKAARGSQEVWATDVVADGFARVATKAAFLAFFSPSASVPCIGHRFKNVPGYRRVDTFRRKEQLVSAIVVYWGRCWPNEPPSDFRRARPSECSQVALRLEHVLELRLQAFLRAFPLFVDRDGVCEKYLVDSAFPRFVLELAVERDCNRRFAPPWWAELGRLLGPC